MRQPVRPPLKWRRWLARLDRRIASRMNRRERDCYGSHERWWRAGQEALRWEEYARENNITDTDARAMSEGVPW